jgi:hypothetical protein
MYKTIEPLKVMKALPNSMLLVLLCYLSLFLFAFSSGGKNNVPKCFYFGK